MMADTPEFDAWLRELECPQEYTSDYVKKTLQKGVLGLLWEDVPKTIRPQSEVDCIRKNILLYKLKNEPNDALIQTVRDTVRMKEERCKLENKIKIAEEKWMQQQFACKQKALLIQKKKEEKDKLEIKRKLLAIKYEEMKAQIKDCTKMQEICQRLMPPTVEEISQSTITKCLSLVSNYCGGPEKRKVWNTISESLNTVKLPVLWNALLTARTNSTDNLINLDLEEGKEDKEDRRTSIDTSIAKLCSEHVASTAKHFIHMGRTKNHQEMTMQYVEKIENIIGDRPDFNEWLPLTLEVRKLEIMQTQMQKELQMLKLQIPDDIQTDEKLNALIAEVKDTDNKTSDCVQEIQNALGLLKSARTIITNKREKLINELHKLQLIEKKEPHEWLDIDLHTELFTLQHNIDINAFRKIMLKGETGSYKHLQTCIVKAPVCLDIQAEIKACTFPMIRTPVYYLIDFYQTTMVNILLNQQINEGNPLKIIKELDSPLNSPIILNPAIPKSGVFELLRFIDKVCKRTRDHGEEFNTVLKAWSQQSIRDVVSRIFCDKTVDGATLDEWQKRFSMVIYVLQKSNVYLE